MPKSTKLHNKIKSTSIQKPFNVSNESTDDIDPEESMRQFQLELCWCVQQLERSLNEKKGTEKQLQETWKVLTVLKNNNQPMIRKRQLMRTHFGDYRAKMAAEEKKLAKMASKIKITEVPDKPKATFLRKSAFLSTGDSSFRFNFHVAPEKVDISKISGTKIDNTTAEPNVPDNTKVQEKTVQNSNSPPGNTKSEEHQETPKKFKFAFTDSQFKFNFNDS